MALLLASSSTEAWAQRPNGKSQESKRDSGNDSKESTQGDELSMAIGQTITLSAKDVKNWNESVPGVIDSKLTPDGKSIVLNARKTGSVTILLIFYDGSRVSHTVTVWPKLPNVVEKEVAQLVDSIPGVRRRRIGARVVLDGQVTSEAELRRIQQIATIYQGQVESLVLGPPSSTGVVSADAGEEEDTLIRVDIYFVQYDKRSGYQVGVGWPESLGATGRLNVDFNIADKTLNSATASLTSQPLPKLDMMSNRGWAKVLKHSTVVTQQGVEAHFQNGGEQLFSVNQGLSTGVERVGFGADVSVMPRFRQERGTLELRVNANVSELSAPGEGSRLPSRITSSLTTNVRLKLGQALILSGFRTKVQTHDVKGLPLLSEIPILGVFFGSHGDRENETEGAVFIIPSVVTTVPMHAAEFVNATLAHFEEYNGDIGTVNTYPKTPTIVEKGEGGSGKK